MIRAIEKGVRAKLVATSAVTALVSTRVYSTQAPAEAALPHIAFFLSGGGSTNDTPRDSLDVLVTVRATAADGATATQVADAVRAALHDADLTLESPWAAYRCQHTTPFYYVETTDRVSYHHAGGVFRVRAAK